MQEKEVCRVAFRLAYNVTDFLLRTITNGIKSGVKYSAPDFNSRSKVQDEVVKEIIGIADAFGQPLTGEQIINMKISSGHKTQMVNLNRCCVVSLFLTI